MTEIIFTCTYNCLCIWSVHFLFIKHSTYSYSGSSLPRQQLKNPNKHCNWHLVFKFYFSSPIQKTFLVILLIWPNWHYRMKTLWIDQSNDVLSSLELLYSWNEVFYNINTFIFSFVDVKLLSNNLSILCCQVNNTLFFFVCFCFGLFYLFRCYVFIQYPFKF